jgi:hypothetical protein
MIGKGCQISVNKDQGSKVKGQGSKVKGQGSNFVVERVFRGFRFFVVGVPSLARKSLAKKDIHLKTTIWHTTALLKQCRLPEQMYTYS